MPRRPADENGLTPQQEKFAIYYVNQYANIADDGDDIDVALMAYRKAYNCNSDAKAATHKGAARKLIKNTRIANRIRELRKQLSEQVGIECAEIVSNDIKALRVDPLELLIFDPKINKYRLRFMHEIPKRIRDVMPYKIDSRGRLIPDIDRNKLTDRIIRVCGFEAAKEMNVHNSGRVDGELWIGFDDDTE